MSSLAVKVRVIRSPSLAKWVKVLSDEIATGFMVAAVPSKVTLLPEVTAVAIWTPALPAASVKSMVNATVPSAVAAVVK